MAEEEIKETHYFLSLSIVLQALFKVPKGIKTQFQEVFIHILNISEEQGFITLKILHIYNAAISIYSFF